MMYEAYSAELINVINSVKDKTGILIDYSAAHILKKQVFIFLIYSYKYTKKNSCGIFSSC